VNYFHPSFIGSYGKYDWTFYEKSDEIE